jgi:two-component system LytT family response regulator
LGQHFEVIFTTSYAKYAIDAIRFSALDYLLKPIDPSLLRVSIDRLRSRQIQSQNTLQIENLLKNIRSLELESQKIALPTSGGFVFVRISDIIRCESENVYTTFFLVDKNQIVVSRSMKDCEDMLQLYRFHRIHQSHLINMRYIKRYKKGEGGEVEMEDGSVLEVSRRKKDEFLQLLNKL